MNGQGSPRQKTLLSGKRQTLVPWLGLLCLWATVLWTTLVQAQEGSIERPDNSLRPLPSLPRQDVPTSPADQESRAPSDISLTAFPANRSADNPAETLDRPSVPNGPPSGRPVRLKFTLGGERPLRWEGHIRIQSRVAGRWQNLSVLSIEPAALGLIRLEGDAHELSIRHSELLAYNSFQVECHADREAQLEIQLRSPDNPQWSFYQTVPFAQLIDATWSLPLANSGHGIWIERPSEDQLHFESSLQRDILELGEAFDIVVIPNHLKVARGTALKYHARVTELSGGNKLVWEERGDLSSEPNGEYPALPTIKLTAGPRFGVYQLQVDLSTARTTLSTFLPSSVVGNPIVATRQMQWVVGPSASNRALEPKPTGLENPAEAANDSTVIEPLIINPAQLGVSPFRPFESQRLPWLPRLQTFQRTAERTYSTRSSETLRSTEIEGSSFWELGTEQWRVIEFPTLDAGWYWIDLELMDANVAQLGLDLVQTDQWNRVPHWTTGSVWAAHADPLLPQTVGAGNPSVRKTNWRTLHWVNPSDSHPATLLCLTNRGKKAPIRIGAITVLRVNVNQAKEATSTAGSSRSVGYYMDTPLLTSIFSGRKPSPTATSPPLNDWLSYNDATDRLAQFLIVKKYNTVWLPVLKQGGTLFPLEGVQTLPRFENSSFGSLAQPHTRMDVVELVLRKLDRQQLSMISVLDLSVALPKDGSATSSASNPLDAAVQQAVLEIIERFAARYHRHAALRGIAIELGPDSPLLFRSEADGLNAETVRRFLSENALAWPANELGNLDEASASVREQWVLQNHSSRWLQWRANELKKFFQHAQAKLQGLPRPINQPALELHLVVTGLHRQPVLRDNLYPSLRGRPSWSEHWLKLGLNLEAFHANEGGLRLMVQQTATQISDIAANRRANVASHGTEFWQVLEKLSGLSFMKQQSLRQAFVEAMVETPSDHVGQSMLTFSVVSSAVGCEQTWAEALRRQDVRSLANQTGGLPRTEHIGEHPFALAFSKLHDQVFTTVYQDAASPVAIRQTLPKNGKAQIYAVNAAAWPVTCTLDIAGANQEELLEWRNIANGQRVESVRLEDTGNRLQPAGYGRNMKPSARLTLTLAPYSLTALEGPSIIANQVNISESAEEASERLVGLKASLFRRLRQAASNATPIETIRNTSFEEDFAKTTGNDSSNWVHGQLKTGQSMGRDSTVAHHGAHSLRIRNSEGVVWLRSNSIPLPTTGRLSVTAWVRTDPERPVESIRLAVDGQGSNGLKYYRFSEIPLNRGASSSSNGQAKKADWQPIAVHFDDLPEEGLASIRIGFDLMKPGDLWIDSVQCFDRWLDANDQNVLSNRLGLAAFSLETKQNTWAALQTLDDYWLRFLLSYVPDPNDSAEVGRSQQESMNEPPSRNARGRRFLPLR
ncbi:MAG: hypothetical protein Q8M16_00160 [Pirellulaceae bacterium]|nr:hypothetical protein [Pirellulaceae bacterium]